jgi:hypothetical protein
VYLPNPYNPAEPLDRRWLRAQHLFQRGSCLSPVHDDHWVGQAVAFLAALAGCRDDEDHAKLAEEMPAVYQAHALHGADPPLLRWAVEARILAREPFDVIARKCGLLAEAVEAFEAIFFSVVDKLHADTWVACNLMGEKAFHGLTEQDLGVWWKMAGYGLGPLVLDRLIHVLPRQTEPVTPEQLDGALDHHTAAQLLDKRLLAAYLLPVTPATAAQVLLLGAQLEVLKQPAAVRPAAPGDRQTPLQAVEDKLLAGLGTPAPTAKPAPKSDGEEPAPGHRRGAGRSACAAA